jgi:myo-inositol-1(or 4)-monophosphatase
MPMARDLRRGGSAATDLAYVAAGRLDGYFERGLSPWDFAAGALLVQEAGGVFLRPEGRDVTRRLNLAGGSRVVEELRLRILETA